MNQFTPRVGDFPEWPRRVRRGQEWEVGALYWNLVDGGATPEEAATKVKQKFLDEICTPERETYFYVGTVLNYPRSWLVISTFWPRQGKSGSPIGETRDLFA